MRATNVLDYLPLRVLSCYEQAMMIKGDKMPAPKMAIIHPNYVCNHRCIGCDYAKLNKTRHSLSDRGLINIIDQLIDLGVQGVEFGGGGEPTLHSSLPKVIDMLIKNNISFGMLTNGTNLTKELQLRFVENGSYCRIGLDSATEKVFNHYKRPKNKNAGLKSVIRNIEDLIRLRNKLRNHTNLQISIKYSVDSNNYSDILRALSLADKLKVDSIQFKLIRNMPSKLKSTKILKSLHKSIEETKNKYPQLRIISNFEKSALKMQCWLSPLQLVIDAYGDVYICCYYRHRSNSHCLGNIFKSRLKDIWYSQNHWTKIKNIKKADCNKFDCRFHYYNELLHELVIDKVGQLNFI